MAKAGSQRLWEGQSTYFLYFKCWSRRCWAPGGRQHDAGDRPETRHKQLWVGAAREVHVVCGREDPVQRMMEVCKRPQHSLHRIQIRRVPGILEYGLEHPRGQEERPPLPPLHPLTSHMGKTLDTFSLRLYCLPLPFFSSIFVGWGTVIKVLGSSESWNKLDTPERYIRYSCFASSLHRIGAVYPPVWEARSDVVVGLNQNK